jgi:hypothetical protein
LIPRTWSFVDFTPASFSSNLQENKIHKLSGVLVLSVILKSMLQIPDELYMWSSSAHTATATICHTATPPQSKLRDERGRKAKGQEMKFHKISSEDIILSFLL